MLKLVKANDAALSDSDIHERIAHKAYELYLQRGREHGYDLDDWLTAECSVQEALPSPPAAKPKSKAATIAHKKIRMKK